MNNTKVVIYEILGAFVIILLLIVLRPLFVGQVASSSSPYTISYDKMVYDTDNESPTYETWVLTHQTDTIQPTALLSTTQTNSIYTVVIFLVALIALVVILLTVSGKL